VTQPKNAGSNSVYNHPKFAGAH